MYANNRKWLWSEGMNWSAILIQRIPFDTSNDPHLFGRLKFSMLAELNVNYKYLGIFLLPIDCYNSRVTVDKPGGLSANVQDMPQRLIRTYDAMCHWS